MENLVPAMSERLGALAEQHGVPGVAAGFDWKGETALACHGVTHVEHPLAVDGGTLFQIASNSKPFVMTLVLALVEEGRLSLDDPVRTYLPEFRMPDPAYDDAVTVRHLLTHTVGWDGDHLFVRQPEPDTLDAIFEPMRHARQLVPPGAAFTYSNAAFSVAGRLVEVLREQSFEEALRAGILEPLGMSRTCLRADEAIFHRVAMRHLSIPDREPIPLPGGGWQSGWELVPFDRPAGGVISSVDDLLAWLRFWLGRPQAEAGALPLGDAMRRGALEDQAPCYSPGLRQVLGWEVRDWPFGRVYGHGGLTAGYCSYTLFAPDLDLAAVVLTNSTSGAAVHRELLRWLVGEVGGAPWTPPEPLEPQPEDLARYVGDYWHSFGTTRVRVTEDGDLELDTARHPTDDGSWQPPPEEPVRARLLERDHAIVTTPGPTEGAVVNFDADAEPPAWLRTGGRIAVRV